MGNTNSVIKFENTELQVMINSNYEVEMDMEELAKAIGFEDQRSIRRLLENSPELKDKEFSYLKKTFKEEGGVLKKREKRIFNEQGIYEVAMLASTERAKKFRRFVREFITKFRRNELIINSGTSLDSLKKLDEIKKIILSNDEALQKVLDFIETAEDKINKLGEMAESIKNLEEDVALIKIELSELTEDYYGSDEDER